MSSPLSRGPTPHELAQAQRLGRYALFEPLGHGGFGSVFRAWDPKLSRWVAIKVLHTTNPRAHQRFLREIQSVSRLRHPHVVEMHDAGRDGERVYLVMEWVQGHSFEDLALGGINAGRAAELVQQVAEAVAHAHRRQIWHRDIKPGNVLVDSAGQARVLDFGLATLLGDDSERLTRTGQPLGTPTFMPPEQVEGRAGPQSDVWGLGALLYFALARRAPFEDADQPMIAVLHSTPTPPRQWVPEIPRALEAICLRCLETQPRRRYADPQAVADALTNYLQGTPQAPPPWGRLVVGAVALVLAVGLGALLAQQARREPPSAASPAEAESPAPSQPPASPATPTVDPEQLLGRARRASKAGAPFAEVAELLNEARAVAEGELFERVELALAALELRRGRLGPGLERIQAHSWEHHPRQAARLEAELLVQQGGTEDPRVQRALAIMIAGPAGPERDSAEGLRAFLSGDLPRAMGLIRQAADASPNDPSAHLLLGRALLVLGDVQGARQAAQLALRLAPDDFRGLTIVRDAALATREPGLSLEASEDLLRLVEDHAVWSHYVGRAKAYSALGRDQEAKRDLDRAIDMSPLEPGPRLERALFLLTRNQPEAARRDLQVAMRTDPDLVRMQLRSLPPQLRGRLEDLLR